MLARDPRLTLDKFWSFLEKIHSRDMSDEYKRRWEEFSFQGGRESTVKEFRDYRLDWESALDKITGVSPEEVARRFLRSLPEYFSKWSKGRRRPATGEKIG